MIRPKTFYFNFFIIIIMVCTLYQTFVESENKAEEIIDKDIYIAKLEQQIREETAAYENEVKELKNKIINSTNYLYFEITAYDLSYNSCERLTTDEWYGISSTGFDLRGKTREEAMAIAVDPRVIPYGSKIEIVFDDKYKEFSGIYTAVDTGGAIKGARIDLYMGDHNIPDNELGMTPEVAEFGRRVAKIRRVE